jgi:hypothetical protein
MERVLRFFAFSAFSVVLSLVPSAASAQGDPQGPEFRVNTFTTSHQVFPSIATLSGGNFVIVWASGVQDGSDLGVFGQRYDGGGTPLGPSFRVNTYTTSHQYRPSVAADDSGNFLVVWESLSQDGSNLGVFGQRFLSSGAPAGPEFRVNTYTTGSQHRASAAFASSGHFVVVWTSDEQDDSSWGVFGQRYFSSGIPVGPEFRVNSHTTDLQGYPSVAFEPSGNFLVVWQTGICFPDPPPCLQTDISGQRFAGSGDPLGPEFRVNTYTMGFQVFPSVAGDSSGFIVVWESQNDPTRTGVFGQRYDDAGVPLGPQFHINTFTSGRQGAPAVASDSAGNFVVVWQSELQDGSTYGVFGQRYDDAGVPQGPEFRVNTFTTNGQKESSVAADPTGKFVVVWQSYGEDGAGFGIFGQRYSMIVPVELMHFGVE